MGISKIFHIADIHCRLFRRHAEYRAVFARLLEFIRRNKDNKSVIYLAGDIVHSKTEMSPELYALVAEFFRACADECPTIVITGNHDCNLKNPHRLDALTPIVDALKHPDLHYWKAGGVYELMGVSFSVFSVFNTPEDWVLASELGGGPCIALDHGPVTGAMTDLNYEVKDGVASLETFRGFDLVLLGDIHRYQYLNAERTVAYPGSLIQQDHGEHQTMHGLLVWDVATRTPRFEAIPNDFVFHTYLIHQGKLVNGHPEAPNVRARVEFEHTDPATVREIKRQLAKERNIVEWGYTKNIHARTVKTYQRQEEVSVGDVRDVEYQNDLIIGYLLEQGRRIGGLEERIRGLNRALNKRVARETVVRHVVWRPKRFEFSNMFSYGPDNVIDFTTMQGVYGLFAPNTFGKSTALDALTFCLFDKSSRASKALHVMNTRLSNFYCKFQFEIEGKDYFIERIAKKSNKGAVRVDVNFWTVEDGTVRLLNGLDRDDTNKIIRDYLGTYDDFVLTTLSTQEDNRSFIGMTQKERKELLYRFQDISIFDDLHKLAKEETRGTSALIKDLESQNLDEQAANARWLADTSRVDLQNLEQELAEVRGRLEDARQRYVERSRDVPSMTNVVNEEDVRQRLKHVGDLLTLDREIYKRLDTEILQLRKILHKVRARIEAVDIPRLTDSVRQYEHYRTRWLELADLKQRNINTRQVLHQKVDHLDRHEYDPTCEYCVRNPFVQDAERAVRDLHLEGVVGHSLDSEMARISDAKRALELTVVEHSAYQDDAEQLARIERDLELLQAKQEKAAYQGRTRRAEYDQLKKTLEDAQRQREALERYRTVQDELDAIQTDIREQEKLERSLLDAQRDVYSQLKRAEADVERLTECQQRLDTLTEEMQAYGFFIEAVGRDGVPYWILKKTIPVIESEVNNMLGDLCDFQVRLETTEDNSINGYIVYSEEKQWPIELTSGMERLVLSLAIRVGLINATSLPKPDFLVIDEGFGVLDGANLTAVHKLFDHLRSVFSFVLCVSHIDLMRDFVDDTITITKTGDFSKITYG
jgi:DNA repair exonuclease SbcCD nuclease subunit